MLLFAECREISDESGPPCSRCLITPWVNLEDCIHLMDSQAASRNKKLMQNDEDTIRGVTVKRWPCNERRSWSSHGSIASSSKQGDRVSTTLLCDENHLSICYLVSGPLHVDQTQTMCGPMIGYKYPTGKLAYLLHFFFEVYGVYISS